MAELNFPDFLGTAQRGYAVGAGMRDDRRQQQDQAQIRALAPQIVGGDLAAYQQAAAVDPAAAQQLQGAGDVTFKRLAGAYKLVDDARKSGDVRAVNAALKQTAPFFSQVLGKPVPTEWAVNDPAWEEGWGKLGQQIAMAQKGGGQGKVFAQKIGDNGNILNTMADGTIVDTGIKADRQAWFRDQPGTPPVIVNKDGSTVTPGEAQGNTTAGQGGSATVVNIEGITPERQQQIANVASTMRAAQVPEDQIAAWISQNLSQPQTVGAAPSAPIATAAEGLPARPLTTPIQEQQMQISQQANARAEEANARAAEAAANSQRGNAPAGFRFKDDGSLEPIPGGPKPAGTVATEGERKAATLLARLTGSLGQLEQAIQEDPSAASPNLLAAGVGKVLGETAANTVTPARRQRVEAAQLDILDAALTLGTGAAYTREQLEGYRKSFFPQIGDSDSTVADKQARLNNVIEAARIAAGRAAPARDAAKTYSVGQTVEHNGKAYRVVGGDPSDPDLEEVR